MKEEERFTDHLLCYQLENNAGSGGGPCDSSKPDFSASVQNLDRRHWGQYLFEIERSWANFKSMEKVPQFFYLYQDEHYYGPFSADLIRRRLLSFELGQDIHLWSSGYDSWQPISECRDFADCNGDLNPKTEIELSNLNHIELSKSHFQSERIKRWREWGWLGQNDERPKLSETIQFTSPDWASIDTKDFDGATETQVSTKVSHQRVRTLVAFLAILPFVVGLGLWGIKRSELSNRAERLELFGKFAEQAISIWVSSPEEDGALYQPLHASTELVEKYRFVTNLRDGSRVRMIALSQPGGVIGLNKYLFELDLQVREGVLETPSIFQLMAEKRIQATGFYDVKFICIDCNYAIAQEKLMPKPLYFGTMLIQDFKRKLDEQNELVKKQQISELEEIREITRFLSSTLEGLESRKKMTVEERLILKQVLNLIPSRASEIQKNYHFSEIYQDLRAQCLRLLNDKLSIEVIENERKQLEQIIERLRVIQGEAK